MAPRTRNTGSSNWSENLTRNRQNVKPAGQEVQNASSTTDDLTKLSNPELRSGEVAAAATLLSPTMSIDEDDICPVCQLLLYRPVTTNCRHTLCKACMAQWAETSVTSRMAPVDVDEDIPGLASSQPSTSRSKARATTLLLGTEAKCPMCRMQTTAAIDRPREQALLARYPSEYERRKAEDSDVEKATASERSAMQTLMVYIGNRHELVPDGSASEDVVDVYNNHEWTFFVRPSRTDIIEEVQILLHPTFRPPRVIRARPPYSIRRLGWGIFTVTAYIILKAGYSWLSPEAQDSPDGASNGTIGLEWTLDFESFEGRGAMERLKLSVKREGGGRVKSKGKKVGNENAAKGNKSRKEKGSVSASTSRGVEQQHRIVGGGGDGGGGENSRDHEETERISRLSNNQHDNEDEEMPDIDENDEESDYEEEEEEEEDDEEEDAEIRRDNQAWERMVREYQRDGLWEPPSPSPSSPPPP